MAARVSVRPASPPRPLRSPFLCGGPRDNPARGAPAPAPHAGRTGIRSPSRVSGAHFAVWVATHLLQHQLLPRRGGRADFSFGGSRRLAALPTLPAPARSQRFFRHPASSETRAPTEGTWAEQWWPDSGWGCCFWHCSYPRRCIPLQRLLHHFQVPPPRILRLPQIQLIPPPRRLVVPCSQQPVSSWSHSLFYISTVKRLRPRNIFSTSPSSKPNPNGVLARKNRSSLNLLIPHLLLTQKMLRIPNLICLKNM